MVYMQITPTCNGKPPTNIQSPSLVQFATLLGIQAARALLTLNTLEGQIPDF